MVEKILNALLATRRREPQTFARIMNFLGKGRAPIEFDAPDIARLPWKETSTGKFIVLVKNKKVVMALGCPEGKKPYVTTVECTNIVPQ